MERKKASISERLFLLFRSRKKSEQREGENVASSRLGRGPGRLWPLAEDAVPRAEPGRPGNWVEVEKAGEKERTKDVGRSTGALLFFSKSTPSLSLTSSDFRTEQKNIRPAATSMCSPTAARGRSRPSPTTGSSRSTTFPSLRRGQTPQVLRLPRRRAVAAAEAARALRASAAAIRED